jgi:NADPH-dependent glutamate synthase beta subunit-like oxidoreductase
LQDVASFYFDEDKRLQLEAVAGSEHVIEADMVIFAVGQRPDVPEGFGIEKTDGGLVAVSPGAMATNREEVFAAGDAVSGTDSVIKAIASGRKAAAAIDKYLGGRGRMDDKLAPLSEAEKRLGMIEGFAALRRVEEHWAPPAERIRNFRPVAASLSAEEAEAEAGRCLQCNLRLKMTPVKFWGSYE